MRFQCIAIQYSSAFRSFSHSVSLHFYVYDVWFVSCTKASKQAKTKLKNLMLSILYALNKHTAFHCHCWVAFHLYCVRSLLCVFLWISCVPFRFLSLHTHTHTHTCSHMHIHKRQSVFSLSFWCVLAWFLVTVFESYCLVCALVCVCLYSDRVFVWNCVSDLILI